MLMRRGDCFGESEICEYYKPVPIVRKEYQDNWPVIMRSNAHSRHLEWKRDQERLANGNEIKYKKRKCESGKSDYGKKKNSMCIPLDADMLLKVHGTKD